MYIFVYTCMCIEPPLRSKKPCPQGLVWRLWRCCIGLVETSEFWQKKQQGSMSHRTEIVRHPPFWRRKAEEPAGVGCGFGALLVGLACYPG